MAPSYTSFETYGNFLCLEEQKEMFEKLQETHPEIIEDLLFMCHEKQEETDNSVVVKIYAEDSLGNGCPKICKDFETFSKLKSFTLHNNVVPTIIANIRWVHENVTIVGK